ncbi:MAG: hypothetical protein C0625_09585 [Arcobacter sp.]|nr:MAG: hypothetical protein C0625_09585 [Arcobacter sp.]
MSINIRNCPNCNSEKNKSIFSKKLKNFDKFKLLCDYKIVQCNDCNFIYNNNIDNKLLNEFYSKESLYSSDSSYGTGGNNSGDIKRYSTYMEILYRHLNHNSIICDVGCGKGGFIKFLLEQKYNNSMGLELDKRLIKLSGSDKILETKLYNYPLQDKKIDCFAFTHVFEHILELQKVITEISRCLKDDGLLFIEVPDAQNYSKKPVFDFYWFTIKEHINHFTLSSLNTFMNNNGFELIEKQQSGIKYNNESYSYPSLRCLFKKTSQKMLRKNHIESFSLDSYINQEKEKTNIHKKEIHKILRKYNYIYFWGIGQEFLTLTSFINIDISSQKIFLIDKNINKQNLTFENKKICDPSSINLNDPKNTCIIICSVFNNNIIKKDILKFHKELHFYEI